MGCVHSALKVLEFAEKEIKHRCPEALARNRGKGSHTLTIYKPPDCLPHAVERYESFKNEFSIYVDCINVEIWSHKIQLSLKKSKPSQILSESKTLSKFSPATMMFDEDVVE